MPEDMATRYRGSVPLFATAAVIFIDAGAARLLLHADESQVYLLGRPLGWTCGFRSRFGLPCPTCGLTRSVLLTLQGDFLRAWAVAPVGPVAAVGVLAFAFALLLMACLRPRGSRVDILAERLRRGALIYIELIIIVWIGGWAAHVAGMLITR